MLGYPTKKKTQPKVVNMANLGMTLESDIEATNQYYLTHNIAVIHKKPTPIQVVNVSYPARNKAKITEAYYRTPSTTDFNGLYKGKYIDFDAKETNSKTSFPLANVHEHQIIHLNDVNNHGGIAFLIVGWKIYNEYYLLPFKDLKIFWDESRNGGRKSIPYDFFKEKGITIPFSYQPRLDYLKAIDILLGQV
ncbi:Holliday junction resolvase RecU [Acholeplasma hippikon]|uniref:Holliday junction resolvase RecU n=1 Tax=Acholeplasma hippikon TaxID=264636 RepID=A0A449BJ79_9MOLU|nr:Holliday junction resolvase RecU [Acholeplasma hippikon]VEU82521.1 penicillin-binding protein-related factor A recombinase [Acholeplasma hippikon]